MCHANRKIRKSLVAALHQKIMTLLMTLFFALRHSCCMSWALNGKIGNVRASNNETGRYTVYFDDKNLKSPSLKRSCNS